MALSVLLASSHTKGLGMYATFYGFMAIPAGMFIIQVSRMGIYDHPAIHWFGASVWVLGWGFASYGVGAADASG